MTAEQAYRLGALWYRDRLDEDWRPKTVATMKKLFAEVGLTGEFWRLG